MYEGLCFTCKYWKGDKEKQRYLIKTDESEAKVCMDKFKGWPVQGVCGIDYEWLDTKINGDAWVRNEVCANFGCNYYENEGERDG